jgi:TPR repeat protein
MSLTNINHLSLLLATLWTISVPVTAFAITGKADMSCQQTISNLFRDAKTGNAEAEYRIGVLFDKSECVPQNLKEAAKWYLRAAEQGNCHAQYNIGHMYHNGQGVEPNSRLAAAWYHRAADQGNVHAQYNLALMYRHGDGVGQDDTLAAEWYSLAAEQGDPDAQNNLAWLYFLGLGVSKNRITADKWFLIAEQNGAGFRTAWSKFYVELSMTRDDQSIARQQAELWKSNKNAKSTSKKDKSCANYSLLLE